MTARSAGLGVGSQFTVSLPRTDLSPARPTVAALSPPAELRSVKKVLVIEDNRDTALTMQILIRRLGYQVDVAGTGPKGVEAARALRPDVVICDLGLPEMDGFGVARMLRSDATTRDAYLIAQSGYGQSEDVRQALEAGFDLHLIKPVDVSDLQRILEESGAR